MAQPREKPEPAAGTDASPISGTTSRRDVTTLPDLRPAALSHSFGADSPKGASSGHLRSTSLNSTAPLKQQRRSTEKPAENSPMSRALASSLKRSTSYLGPLSRSPPTACLTCSPFSRRVGYHARRTVRYSPERWLPQLWARSRRPTFLGQRVRRP